MDGIAGLKGWQWLFILEGLPACIMGLVTLRILRDKPGEALWLMPDERTVLTDELALESASRPRKNLLAALKDRKVLILTGILFSYWIGISGIAIWLPLILKGHGLTDTEVGLYSALPYLVGSVAMIFWARHIERTGKYLLNLARRACCRQPVSVSRSCSNHCSRRSSASLSLWSASVRSGRLSTACRRGS